MSRAQKELWNRKRKQTYMSLVVNRFNRKERRNWRIKSGWICWCVLPTAKMVCLLMNHFAGFAKPTFCVSGTSAQLYRRLPSIKVWRFIRWSKTVHEYRRKKIRLRTFEDKKQKTKLSLLNNFVRNATAKCENWEAWERVFGKKTNDMRHVCHTNALLLRSFHSKPFSHKFFSILTLAPSFFFSFDVSATSLVLMTQKDLCQFTKKN